MSEHIVVEQRGAVQLLRLNRPDKKNAISRSMYRAMTAALRGGDADPAIRVHVLLGAAGAFAAGNDLADFLAAGAGNVAAAGDAFAFLEALCGAAKPIVSGVDGLAIGIGATIHLHCDLTFATPASTFRAPFVDLGLVPEAGSSLLLPALLGRQRAFAMLVLGEALSAEAAKAAGLIWDIVAPEQLDKSVVGAAERLAAKPPKALALARGLLRAPREPVLERIRAEAALFGEALQGEEARAAFSAFFNRRTAG